MKSPFSTLTLAVVLTFLGAAFAGAATHDPPYARLARDLGTPNLARSIGPKDKSQLQLNFVKAGETYARWTKMTSISIVKVKPADTTFATRSVVSKFKAALQARHARIVAFDESPKPPVNAYFTFFAGGESNEGIAYSPASGFVSLIQVGRKNGVAGDPNDAKLLEKVAGR